MISDITTAAAPIETARPAPRSWRLFIDRARARLSALVDGLLRDPETFAPDPFSTEVPFLSDSWPRH